MASDIVPQTPEARLDATQPAYTQQSSYLAISYPRKVDSQCCICGVIYAGPHQGKIIAIMLLYDGVDITHGFCPNHMTLERQVLYAKRAFHEQGTQPNADVQKYFFLRNEVYARNGTPIEQPFWHTNLYTAPSSAALTA